MILKGASFLTDKIKPQDIFIAEEWTEEHLLIKETILQFVEQEIHSLEHELDASKDQDKIVALLEKAAELGLCGLSIPTEYGGMGMDFTTGLLFSENISQGYSFATTIGAQTSIGSLPIVYYGTDEQKAKYLPKIATAEYKAAYALTEPGAGSDANSGKTNAIPTADGKHYILNGQKMWITNGGFADIFIVFAKIENDENLSAFIVEKAFGGITLGQEEKKLGIKGSSTVQVFFNDCKVPAENLLAKRQDGFKIALNILNSGRIKLASGSVGGSKTALSKAIEYAIERKQFDKSISEFGAMKYKIGEMAQLIYATESAIYRVGKNIDDKEQEFLASGTPKDEVKLKALREYAIECAILKVYGSEILAYSVDETIQIFGGMGYSVETGVEMGYRDARITRIYEGTNEINRLLSFGELMKRAFGKEKEIDLIKAGRGIPMSLALKSIPYWPKPNHEEAIDNMRHLFLLISGVAGKKLKLKLVDEQEIVMDLADMLAEIYICDSLLARVRKVEMKNDPALAVKKQILDLHVYEAIAKVKNKAHKVIDSLPQGTQRGLLKWATRKFTNQIAVNPKDTRRAIADYMIKEGKYAL